MRVKPEDFDPYPGAFLKEDLEEKVEKASRILAEMYRKEGDPDAAEESLKTVALMREAMKTARDPFKDYLTLQSRWERLMTLFSSPDTRNSVSKRLWKINS